MSTRALIYAIGHDSQLRAMSWELLLAGLVTRADLIDRAELYIKEGYKRKIRQSGRAITMECDADQIDEVMKKMKLCYPSPELQAWALPVLAHI